MRIVLCTPIFSSGQFLVVLCHVCRDISELAGVEALLLRRRPRKNVESMPNTMFPLRLSSRFALFLTFSYHLKILSFARALVDTHFPKNFGLDRKLRAFFFACCLCWDVSAHEFGC
jgi:hypothetical protein